MRRTLNRRKIRQHVSRRSITLPRAIGDAHAAIGAAGQRDVGRERRVDGRQPVEVAASA